MYLGVSSLFQDGDIFLYVPALIYSNTFVMLYSNEYLMHFSTFLQVFVRAVHEAKWMSEMEISIYDSWFNPVVSELPGLVPDAFIYLRASPDTCLQRLHSRKRQVQSRNSCESCVVNQLYILTHRNQMNSSETSNWFFATNERLLTTNTRVFLYFLT